MDISGAQRIANDRIGGKRKSMTHPIDLKLKVLSPPLRPAETLEVYFYSNKKPIPGLNSQVLLHAFSTAYVMHNGAPLENFSGYVSDKSPDTSHMRGNLGAMLTVLNWLALNGAENFEVKIYGKTFVAEHLPKEWLKWERQPSRPNRDLLEKFRPYFSDAGWRYSNWEVNALTDADRPKSKHHGRLDLLRKRVDRELAVRVREVQPEDLPFDIVEAFDEQAEQLFRRALARDGS
jgi:hypothetical protein